MDSAGSYRDIAGKTFIARMPLWVRGLLCIPMGILIGALLGYLLFQILVPILTPFFPTSSDPYAANAYYAHIDPIASFFRNNIGFALIVYLGALFSPPKAQLGVGIFLYIGALLLAIPALALGNAFSGGAFPVGDLLWLAIFGFVTLIVIWKQRQPR